MTENSTHYLIPGVGEVSFGTYLKTQWNTPPGRNTTKQTPKKTAEEIADDVILCAGLKIKSEETDHA